MSSTSQQFNPSMHERRLRKDSVGRRLLTGITSTIRSKSGYSKHGVVPTPFTTSEEATTDSSFSGDLTETCTSEPLQEIYCSSDVDSDREGYEKSPRSSHHSTGYRATLTSGARSSQTDSDSGDNKTTTTKKSLKSLFRSTTSSKRGSAGDYAVQEKSNTAMHSNKFEDAWSSTPSAATLSQASRRSIQLHQTNPMMDKDEQPETAPKRSSVQMLVSPFTRKTSIRMVAESTSKYSICLPLEDDGSPADSSNQMLPHEQHEESDSSIESLMRNAFASDVDISLLDKADFSFPVSPSFDAPRTDTKKKARSATLSRRRTRSGYATTRARETDDYLSPYTDDNLKVPSPKRSSFISMLTPRTTSPTGFSSKPVTPRQSSSESTSRGLMALGNGKKGSSIRSVSSQAVPTIQTEIAEPTFIRSRAISMTLRGVDSKVNLCNNFLGLGSDLMGLTTKHMKHFKSESDLIKLKVNTPPSRSESDLSKYPSKTSSESKESSSSNTTLNESRPHRRSATMRRPTSPTLEDDSLISLLSNKLRRPARNRSATSKPVSEVRHP
ncbi:hypothetical protein K450DRAFT_254993 [Umbelopsis ramanniana AG]|uniref:Uncharacterized protein n=1 Tax=Umbelopsis ramanniana AG TaxID=1314678 RepID=A0AAD5HBS5_UMBRA|nr:uncharacterized protein K450DRAFT_254993 [Umbelopsis ramanniana AG]KAI8576796.1 hypothetical protein K450DRAFT_254993 [Umbelopsis ramanniana AG]